jgi:hypothetical protein
VNTARINRGASARILREAVLIGFSTTGLLVLATSAHADNLVVNGSFETTTNGAGQLGYNTDATGWTVQAPGSSYIFLYTPGIADTGSAPTGQYGQNPLWGPGNGSNNGLTATSPDGGNFIAMDADFQTSAITQTISGLTDGDSYAVNFWWAAAQQYNFFGPTQQNITVGLGSQTQTTSTYSLPSEGFSGWMYQTFDFTADGSSDVLSFLAGGSPAVPPFTLLDGVSMNVAPTPEPGSLPLLFTGLMGGLAVLRSKKWLKR